MNTIRSAINAASYVGKPQSRWASILTRIDALPKGPERSSVETFFKLVSPYEPELLRTSSKKPKAAKPRRNIPKKPRTLKSKVEAAPIATPAPVVSESAAQTQPEPAVKLVPTAPSVSTVRPAPSALFKQFTLTAGRLKKGIEKTILADKGHKLSRLQAETFLVYIPRNGTDGRFWSGVRSSGRLLWEGATGWLITFRSGMGNGLTVFFKDGTVLGLGLDSKNEVSYQTLPPSHVVGERAGIIADMFRNGPTKQQFVDWLFYQLAMLVPLAKDCRSSRERIAHIVANCGCVPRSGVQDALRAAFQKVDDMDTYRHLAAAWSSTGGPKKKVA